jgi:hypothetical protein
MPDSQNATVIKTPTGGSGGGATAHHGLGWTLLIASPWLMGIFAVLVLVAWYIATQFSMNTSEVMFMSLSFGHKTTSASAVAHFSIPQQFLDLIGGVGTQEQLMTEGWGFFLEVLNLVFAVGISYALHVVQSVGGAVSATVAKESLIRHRSFLLFLFALLGTDIYASATYGSASTAGSILFAVLLQFVAFFCLPLGIIFIRAAIILARKK